MTHIIIRDVDDSEVDDLLDAIAIDYGLMADVIEEGETA